MQEPTTTQFRSSSATSTIGRPTPPQPQSQSPPQIPSQPTINGAAPLQPSDDPRQSLGIVREMPPPGCSNRSGSGSLLHPESVYPIQIGSDLFRLSGASLTSDAPSYFTRYFEEQIRETNGGDSSAQGRGVRTLYIDRDPGVFRDIARHLQGYHIQPLDGGHYVRLFADAQFYGLPRLVSQLFSSETFIQIGDRHFQIPKDIFSSPGDSPNYFTLGFAAFFASPEQVFPGLERAGLLRPPPILPPSVPSRSAHVFEQLLHALRGYPLRIEDEEHRAELLRDCRYFHLRGLEQRLVKCEVGFDSKRRVEEIVIRLEDVKTVGLSVVGGRDRNKDPPDDPDRLPIRACGGWVHYKRPFVDDRARELIVEIGGDENRTMLDLDAGRATFRGSSQMKMDSLLRVVAKADPDIPLYMSSVGGLPFVIDERTDIALDGEPAGLEAMGSSIQQTDETATRRSKKRKLDDTLGREPAQWEVRTGQWKLSLQRELGVYDMEIVLVAIKIDAFTCERARNARRRFLS